MSILLFAISCNAKDRSNIRGTLRDCFADSKIHLGVVSECSDDVGVSEVGLFEDIRVR